MVVNETFVKKRKMHKITLELNESEYMRLSQAIDETSTFDDVGDLFLKAVDDAIEHKRTLDDCYNYGFEDINLQWMFHRIMNINNRIIDNESCGVEWHTRAAMLKESMCDMCAHLGLSDIDDIAHGTIDASGLGLFDIMKLAYLSIMGGFRRFARVADITDSDRKHVVPYMSLVDDIQKNFKNLLLNVNPTEDTEQFLEKQGIEGSYEAMYDIIFYMLTRVSNNTKEYQSTSCLKDLITIYEMTGKTKIDCLNGNESTSDDDLELYVRKAVTDMMSGISHDGFDVHKIIPPEILTNTSTTTASVKLLKNTCYGLSSVIGERELAMLCLNAIYGKAVTTPKSDQAFNVLKPTSELVRILHQLNLLRSETPADYELERKLLARIIKDATCKMYYDFRTLYVPIRHVTDSKINRRVYTIVNNCKPKKYKKWKKNYYKMFK